MNYISIGGWCGTKIGLREAGLFDEPTLPFDSVRTSMEGIIDCIENDFQNFFPKEIKIDERFALTKWDAFMGEFVGFFHHNLLDPSVIEAYHRRFARFHEKVKRGRCVFLRYICRDNYEDEIKLHKRFQEVIDKKYPDVSYILCFLLPNQEKTEYYKHLDERTFLFALNDLQYDNTYLKDECRPIYDFIATHDLFTTVPEPNTSVVIRDFPSRLWRIDGLDGNEYPMVNYVEN